MVHKSSVPLFWRLSKSRYTLTGTVCKTCGSYFFPPKTLCTKCRRHGKIEPYKFSGDGEIVSFTNVHVAPDGFEKAAPYMIAIIRLKEGVNVSGQIIGSINDIAIGKKVRPVFRRIFEDGDDGLIHYGLKWEIIR